MTNKYQVTKAGSFLYGIGVNFWEFGTISKGKVKIYDYFKIDAISEDQKAKILEWCKDASFLNSHKEFAPELKAKIVAFPKAGFYRIKES